jgi:hypothetical protein
MGVAPGTIRSGGQHTYGDAAVRAPGPSGSCCAHVLGLGQHTLRWRAVGGPVRHGDALLGQQSPCVGLPQNDVRLSQHFLPQCTCPDAQRLQMPRSGFWQCQFVGQQATPQRARPLGHFGVQVSIVVPA